MFSYSKKTRTIRQCFLPYNNNLINHQIQSILAAEIIKREISFDKAVLSSRTDSSNRYNYIKAFTRNNANAIL